MSINPWVNSEHLPDRNTSDIPQCLVLSCSGSAEQVWTEATVASYQRLMAWPVCREHYLKLNAGEAWEAMSGGPRSFRRWLLMGAHLEIWPRPMPGRRIHLDTADALRWTTLSSGTPQPSEGPDSA